jgi:hypothetical protein
VNADERADIHRYPLFDPRPEPLPVPTESWNDSPRRVLCINAAWASHVLGVLSRLERSDAWAGGDDELRHAQNQLSSIIAALSTAFDGDCPVDYPATIEDGPATASVPEPEVSIEYITGAGGCGLIWEECFEMPCINLTNYLEIRNGNELWVKDDCCEWVKLGAFTGQVSIDGGTNPLDDPADETQVWSGCGKADALIDALAAMMEAGLQYYTSPFEFSSRVSEAVPGASMGSFEMGLLLFDFITITKLISDETLYNADLIARAKCLAAPHLADTSEVTYDEFSAVVNALSTACRTGQDSVTGTYIYTLWEQCWQTLGYDDCVIQMQFGAANVSAECDCPTQSFGETVPTASGWYFSAPYQFDGVAPGGFNDGKPWWQIPAPEDIFGFAWYCEHTGGDNILRQKRSDTLNTGILDPDVLMNGGMSENLGTGIWYVQCGNAIQKIGGQYSDNPQAPAALAGQQTAQAFAVRADGDDNARAGYHFELRWLYNTNSPSHQ